MEISHYETSKDFKYWGVEDRESAMMAGREDDQRRFEQLRNVIANKKWMDVGTGAGGILDLLAPVASETAAVEPQENPRQYLIKAGYNVYASVADTPSNDFDVVTLFHVFEHLTDPLGTLEAIKTKMARGAQIVIEVPHARDFLISFLDLEEFKAFTFWSEHLILHTRASLSAFLEKAGFSNVSIKGYQRYPLANHLHWLAKRKPGGHVIWNHLRTQMLDTAYGDMLASLDTTDTLIAVATNG